MEITFDTKPFEVNKKLFEAFFGVEPPQFRIKTSEYHFGSIQGLYVPGSKDLEIMTIFNSCPGNGLFEKFLDALEALAEKECRRVRLISFINMRLYHHIKKRGTWISANGTVDDLEYIPKSLKKDKTDELV